MAERFSYRLAGTTGCQVIDDHGVTVAWATNEAWAAVIVALLNKAEVSINLAALDQCVEVG